MKQKILAFTLTGLVGLGGVFGCGSKTNVPTVEEMVKSKPNDCKTIIDRRYECYGPGKCYLQLVCEDNKGEIALYHNFDRDYWKKIIVK